MSQKLPIYDDFTVKGNITFFGGIYGYPEQKSRRKENN